MRSDYAVVRPDLLRELSLKQISKPQVEALVKRLRAKAKIVKSLDAPTSTTP